MLFHSRQFRGDMVDKEEEKYRSQKPPLRYAIRDLCRFATSIFCHHSHRPTNEEILDPVENLISKLQGSEFWEENGMIKPIKKSWRNQRG